MRRPHVWLAHVYRRSQMRKARAAGMRMAEKLVTVGYAGFGNKGNPENWRGILRNLPVGTYEIYCHPAYHDDTLQHLSVTRQELAQEQASICHRELGDLARTAAIE